MVWTGRLYGDIVTNICDVGSWANTSKARVCDLDCAYTPRKLTGYCWAEFRNHFVGNNIPATAIIDTLKFGGKARGQGGGTDQFYFHFHFFAARFTDCDIGMGGTACSDVNEYECTFDYPEDLTPGRLNGNMYTFEVWMKSDGALPFCRLWVDCNWLNVEYHLPAVELKGFSNGLVSILTE